MRHYLNAGSIPASVAAPAPKGFSQCFTNPDLLIKLEQRTNKAGRFRVTYGLEVHDDLTYNEACYELGRAMLHALACNSMLSNEGD
ncbi:hypothetical protein [Cupriavidus basilensis]|uniref:hypothetical protein n=1 Tax=Cupriavidus basilensis TaxID=68895 RepID=UPI0020A65EEB|nr:hypothetical protein [Cupriavidus basilensis]MCP3017414.1 hypothetical protein [Cupriavidus basilensis]